MAGEFCRIGEAVAEEPVKNEFQVFLFIFRYSVDNPFSVSGVLHQICVPQDPQLVRDPGLLHPEYGRELAHAEIFPEEKQKDSQTRWVGQGFEDFSHSFHILMTSISYEHIFIYYKPIFVKSFFRFSAHVKIFS